MLELKSNEELKKLNNDKNLSLSSLKDTNGALRRVSRVLKLIQYIIRLAPKPD
jgi:hypothetical protein